MSVLDAKTLSHVRPLMTLASPIILNALFQQACGMSTIVFVGNYLGPKYMGSVILGSMLCNISGYSIGYGMLSALDTLISQAFGAKEYLQMGLFTQRAMAILTLCCIPIILLWRYGTSIILEHALFIDSDIAALSGEWAKYISFGVWPSFMFEVLKKFFQGQNIIWPIMIASGIGLASNIIFNHVFLVIFKMGIQGPAMSVVIGNWVNFLSLVVIMLIRKAVIKYRGHQTVQVTSNSSASIKYSELNSDEVDHSDEDVAMDRMESNPITDGETSTLTSDHIELHSLKRHVLTRQETSMSDKSGTTTVDSNSDDNSKYSHCNSSSDGSTECSDSSNSNKLSLSDKLESSQLSLLSSDNSIVNDPENNWPPVSIEIFHEWVPFLKLGIPGAVSLFIEWGSFELAAGLSGQLGSTALAVHSIYMQSCAMLYMPPLAVASAASIMVGNFLGDGNFTAAKEVVNLGILLDFSWGFGVGFLLYVFRHWWVMLFTQDKAVVALSDATMPIMFLYIIVDAMKCITLNLLRSTGQPEITVYFNFGSCLCVLLPVGYLLGIYYKLGLWGIWGGMSCAWSLCAIIYFYCLMKTNWEKQRVVGKVSTVSH